MGQVKVLHLSDIHFSERDFWKGLYETNYIPHRHGHDPTALLALDSKIKEIEFDLVILSGDLSRAGHLDSFAYVKNWLYEKMKVPGGGEIGLNLQESEKRCFVIPGNHDCFNEHLKQHSLENYHRFFPDIQGGTIEKIQVNGISVNLHLFDSTYDKGGFAKGFISGSALQQWKTDDATLDLVVVHHHLAQAPNHKRLRSLELLNMDQFLAFILSKNINGVFFGHTHQSFFEKVSAEMLKKQIMHKRKWPRFMRQLLPRWFNAPAIDSVSFSRQKTMSGRYPSFDKYFEYLYIKNVLREPINGPESFREPKHFYHHIDSFRSDYDKKTQAIRKKKAAFSMAATPTYAGAEEKGFQVVTFDWDGKQFLYDCEKYTWSGGAFELEQN